MNQLELLWHLENQMTLVEGLIKEFVKINNDSKIKDLTETSNLIESNILKIKSSLIHNNLLLKRDNKLLTEYNYKINNLREDLYSGVITDLEQLNYLNREKEKLKEIINNTEINILTMMEEIEEMELDLNHKQAELIFLSDEISELKAIKKMHLFKLEKEIKKSEEKLDLVKNKIDLKLLDRYNLLRNTRESSVAAVKEGICTGCNMRVPTYQIDLIKNKEDIIYCESCGRILYYIDIKVE